MLGLMFNINLGSEYFNLILGDYMWALIALCFFFFFFFGSEALLYFNWGLGFFYLDQMHCFILIGF